MTFQDGGNGEKVQTGGTLMVLSVQLKEKKIIRWYMLVGLMLLLIVSGQELDCRLRRNGNSQVEVV